MATNTIEEYNRALHSCKSIFLKKAMDYGTSWRILRTSSLTDQLFIKASRIRSLEEKGVSLVEEPIEDAYQAMVNYGIMALIQLDEREDLLELSTEYAEQWYDEKSSIVRELMLKKNHDYGEAWRDMRTSSMTDLILMKLLRIKRIEENDGKTIISEGLDANYMDIINYSLFALIKLKEKKTK